MKLWKKRWFVLSDMCLFYYRGEDTQTHVGTLRKVQGLSAVFTFHTNIQMWKIFTVYIRGLYFCVVYLPDVVINMQQRATLDCYPSHGIIMVFVSVMKTVLSILITSVSTPLFSSFISKNQSMVVKTLSWPATSTRTPSLKPY